MVMLLIGRPTGQKKLDASPTATSMRLRGSHRATPVCLIPSGNRSSLSFPKISTYHPHLFPSLLRCNRCKATYAGSSAAVRSSVAHCSPRPGAWLSCPPQPGVWLGDARAGGCLLHGGAARAPRGPPLELRRGSFAQTLELRAVPSWGASSARAPWWIRDVSPAASYTAGQGRMSGTGGACSWHAMARRSLAVATTLP
jgi:hypothetical protein